MIPETMVTMTPPTWILVGVAGGIGAAVGILTRRRLASLSYRIGAELEGDAPPQRWWVVYLTIAAWLGLAVRAAVGPDSAILMVPLIPLAITGPWLAGVDFDVLRLPNRVLVPTLIGTVALVAAVVGLGHADAAISATVGVLTTAGMLALLHFATNQLGAGDVKLAAIIGLALGTRAAVAPLVAVAFGSLAALVWIRITKRQGPLPYGPWLILGGLTAALTF